MFEAELFFKGENFQKVGAFKARGAVNAVFSLEEDLLGRGVATHSSGNHAAALAYAACCRGTRAYVVMPENAPLVKRNAVAGYGAEITFCPPGQLDREQALQKLLKETGAVFIHPYDNCQVIAGQATSALELLEQVPGLDIIIAPVGGGGLLSGTALAALTLESGPEVFGAEPKGADDAFRSMKAGFIVPMNNPDTIADGLLTSLGELTFPIINRHVKAILTVSDKAIVEAMRLIWERMKLVIEPSAAVPLAVLIESRLSIKASRVGIILSGGNADLDNLPWASGIAR
jgi:threonine dehydratase